MTITTEFEGLFGTIELVRNLPKQNAKALRLAINTVTARAGMKMITGKMYNEVGFPTGYLKGDRIGVTQYANESNLEAVITARKRATSLARFAASGTPIGSKARTGVRVMVKNGHGVTLKNAWLVRLRKGKSLTEDNFNVGLAVRVKQGDSIMSKHSAHQAWLNPQHTVALLYGPSVDQVFSNILDEVGPPILDLVADEYFRQLGRL